VVLGGRETVEAHDLVVPLAQPANQAFTEVPGTSGDEYAHQSGLT
jgi:hypothetical protein